MGPGENCYKVLGLQRSATDAEIRQAYKKAALRWHPDKNPGDRAGAEIMFKKVAAAYKLLIDPVQRRAFDAKVEAKPSDGVARAPAAFPPRPGASTFFTPPAPTPPGTVDSTSTEDAHNLFKEFFGNDPFKEFDSLFKDSSPENLDAFFAQQSRRGAAADVVGHMGGPGESFSSSSTRTTTRTTTVGSAAGSGRPAFVSETTRVDNVQHRAAPPPGSATGLPQASWSSQQPVGCRAGTMPAAPPPHPAVAGSRGPRVRCLAPNGVAYRRSTDPADRLQDVRGPNCGDVVAVIERRGDWVRCAKGWLPLTSGSQQLLELLDCSAALRARCLVAQGVAYRGSMDLDNRLMHVRGPSGGELVDIEERFGEWIRTAAGWLPLSIGGEPKFEILEAAATSCVGAPAAAPANPAGTTQDMPWSGFWPLSLPRWPFAVFPVLGTGLYVTMRASWFLFRTWWRMTFSAFPRLFY